MSERKIATLHLSGTEVGIGFVSDADPRQNSVMFWTDEQGEAIYINPTEARLLIAALACAVEEAEEARP
jgi:hypothetical protein